MSEVPMKPPKTIVTVLESGVTNGMIQKLQRAGYCPIVVKSHESLNVTQVHDVSALPPGKTLAAALAVIGSDDSHNKRYLIAFARAIISLLQDGEK